MGKTCAKCGNPTDRDPRADVCFPCKAIIEYENRKRRERNKKRREAYARAKTSGII